MAVSLSYYRQECETRSPTWSPSACPAFSSNRKCWPAKIRLSAASSAAAEKLWNSRTTPGTPAFESEILADSLKEADGAKRFEADFEGGTDPSAILALIPGDERQQSEILRHLAEGEGVSVLDLVTPDMLATAIAETRRRPSTGESAGGPGPAAVLARFPTDKAVVDAAKEAAAARVAGPDGATWRGIVQAVQDESIVDEDAFREYLRTTFRDVDQKNLRDFGWDVYGIVTSKATLPDLTYRPSRSSEATVRFRDGRADRLGINSHIGETRWDGVKLAYLDTGQRAATLWVKVGEGAWSKDGNWGGRLQVTCATAEGQWIDSSDGWVRPQSAKGDPITFYDMGPYYEIWQKDCETGRPLTIQDGYLRFVKGATPGTFNLQDATWT
ncbi:hypothetical protein ACFW1A_07345 [Kitasatospora sp. NPDC058965]|uniref:hypothetical protein n=1 Tax=Kitasatospora sp. NPDC058965 TaxID=3346682 RepID=UPI00369C71BF